MPGRHRGWAGSRDAGGKGKCNAWSVNLRRETEKHIGDCAPHAYICEIRFETHLPQSQLRLPANDAARFPSAMNDVCGEGGSREECE